ncbi:Yrb2 protein [Martiniozyma asiatica (nom. inval.)]|nr:Yrb2 protein [Martiniozyma asiatica]
MSGEYSKKRILEEENNEIAPEVKKVKTEFKSEEDKNTQKVSLPVSSSETHTEQDKELSTTEKSGSDTKVTNEVTLKEEETIKPKYVFGSSTSFGKMGGFKMTGNSNTLFKQTEGVLTNLEAGSTDKSGKSIFGSGSSFGGKVEFAEGKSSGNEDNKEAKTKIFGSSVFGSNSTFGDAFKDSLNKKSIFDEKTAENEDENEDENENKNKNKTDDTDEKKEEEEKKDVYKTVHLEKQEVKSGEEDETTLFQAKAKLYYMDMDTPSDGWKEKGLGIIRVNKYHKPLTSYHSRLIMRQDGNLKLILNLPLVKGFNIVKGMPSSLHANKFLRIQTVEGEKPVQYALKLQVDNVSSLFETVQTQIPK